MLKIRYAQMFIGNIKFLAMFLRFEKELRPWHCQCYKNASVHSEAYRTQQSVF